MIAIGGSIGAGLFVGSGGALASGGPASLVIDFAIIGVMIFNVVYALGELAIMYPVSGGFYTYSTRFVSPSWGMAVGWNYALQWAAVLPFEIVVAAECIRFWGLDISPGVWYTIFIAAIVIVSLFGVLGYGEEEFWASLLKLSTVIIFMVTGLVLVLGGGPEQGRFSEYWGARTWYDPGPFRNGVQGFCKVFVTAAFSFSGTELVGLAAAEAKAPLKALPSAVKQVFWRITLFYILALTFVGLLVRSDDPRLFGAGNFIDTTASPFVIVAVDAGLRGFDSFLNVVILVSVLSIGLSGVYGGSRTLTALAEHGYAPGLFAYVDRAGRPLFSTVALCLMGCLAYIGLSENGVTIFDWLLAISGMAALFTWGSICFAHIRFRAAWSHQGRSLDDIPFKSTFGVIGSWIGLIIVIVVLILQFYVALFPPDASNPGHNLADAESFFKAYLAAFVILGFWLAGVICKGRRFSMLKLSEIDLDTGRREIDWASHRAEEARRAEAGLMRRIAYKLF